jgi:hypothetical protein
MNDYAMKVYKGVEVIGPDSFMFLLLYPWEDEPLVPIG